jgi:hypothetical protein
MKPSVLALCATLLTVGIATSPNSRADDDVLQWSWQAVPVPGTTDQVDLVFTSPIKDGWILYASDFSKPEFGPRPAQLLFADNAASSVAGDFISVGSVEKTDRNFQGEYTYRYFAGKAELRQRIRTSPDTNTVSGTLVGQTCFEASGLCALVREAFTVSLH